jgi:hypothetical protein
MRTFHVLLEDDGSGTATRVDFQAESRDCALVVAQGHSLGRSMELWEGPALVGTLNKSAPQLWRLG